MTIYKCSKCHKEWASNEETYKCPKCSFFGIVSHPYNTKLEKLIIIQPLEDTTKIPGK